MRVAFASDHAGWPLRWRVIAEITTLGFEPQDCGPPEIVPGDDYPSGGPTSNMLDVWKAAAPAIDILAPDIYVPNTERYRSVMQQFSRADNPLLIPETHGFGTFAGSQGNARNLFLAIGAGAIGFAPIGLDSYAPQTRDGARDFRPVVAGHRPPVCVCCGPVRDVWQL